MKKINNAPGWMRGLLILCLVGLFISSGITYFSYRMSKNTVEAVGIDTVPSIIAAQNIKATLADAHSNAMNAMVTNEKPGGRFWTMYRQDMDSLHSQLVDASKNISYGDAERIPLMNISSNISAYEYTVGGAVANGAKISVDQFMEANRLMQQRILPASTALNNVNLSQLEWVFNNYSKNVNITIAVIVLTGLIFLAVLVFCQVSIFRITHRIVNPGLFLATVLFLGSLLYSVNIMGSVKADLYSAKKDAFKSINALWNARATGYNAKSIQSLYLLHEGTGIVQTADTINFNLAAERIYVGQGKNEGYLYEALSNLAYPGGKEAADTVLNQWVKYVDIDKKVHNLEYDSRHSEAIALSVGDGSNQAYYEFSKFDSSLGDIIENIQESFDLSINSAHLSLKWFPYILGGLMILTASLCIIGIRARINEYRV